MSAYSDVIERVYSLQKFGIKLGLTNMENLMDRLDHPERKLKSILIAGTNGKGSTGAMVCSILSEAGYRVGFYTSPHLVSFRERIRIGKELISKSEVVSLAESVAHSLKWDLPNQSQPPPATATYFEFVTAMALLYFVQKGVDLAVMEVGMGGRLDATNITSPLLSVITMIDYDHTEYLGKTLAEIASEKAGIIRESGLAIVSRQKSEARNIILKICQKIRANVYISPLNFHGKRISYKPGGQFFDFWSPDLILKELPLNLPGRFQIENASTAIQTCLKLKDLGFPFSLSHLANGLNKVKWEGRLEFVESDPRILLDGAHNRAGARELARFLRTRFSAKRKILILGIMADKDLNGMLKYLVPLADELILTKAKIDRAADPQYLRHLLPFMPQKIVIIPNIPEAIAYAKKEASETDLICITGSLFTVGEARQVLYQLEGDN